jgi:MFS family permease
MQTTKLSKKVWFSLVFYGLIGQIAWVVENMYFATLCQDIFGYAGRADLSYIITTLMVILSAITATLTTFIAGAFSDRLGKRKPFIGWGYFVWGLTIMLFALIPMRIDRTSYFRVAFMLIFFDCLMTVAGSTSNDAAFNAWVADRTDSSNRGLVNTILSMMPVFAVIVVFIGLGSLYSAEKESNHMFFVFLGCFPLIAGLFVPLLVDDGSKTEADKKPFRWYNVFYGFQPKVISENKLLYITLAAFSLVAISQQTFFSYLINFLSVTLGYGGGFVVPMAVILIGSAIITGVLGVLFDRHGRKKFYLPLTACILLGTLSFYFLQYISGNVRTIVLYAGGLVMMSGFFSLTGALQANFQDLIPANFEGRFQGVRMCFSVLIPMIIGPIVSLFIGLNAMGINEQGFAPTYNIFLAASIIAALAFIPVIKIQKNSIK